MRRYAKAFLCICYSVTPSVTVLYAKNAIIGALKSPCSMVIIGLGCIGTDVLIISLNITPCVIPPVVWPSWITHLLWHSVLEGFGDFDVREPSNASSELFSVLF